MQLTIPELSLVLMMGPSGSGKSSFARQHFKEFEIVSSDRCRALVSNDEGDQSASGDAFDVLFMIAHKRLQRGLLTVIDATNLQTEARRDLLQLALTYHVFSAIIALDVDEDTCLERASQRVDRTVPAAVIKKQVTQMQKSLQTIEREGFRYIFHLKSQSEIEAAVIERQKMRSDRREEKGPFDIIGDIHGCRQELDQLLVTLGYTFVEKDRVVAPHGRKVIFLGDLVDRGPDTPGVLRLVMNMFEEGLALCVPGNHDVKLMKKLKGQKVQVKHGLAESLEQLGREPQAFCEQVIGFVDGLVSHLVLDEGRLVAAHAGLKESMHGRESGAVRSFALYGDATGEIDAYGLPVRLNWASEYRGKAMVVYGHTSVLDPEWQNGTINIDTGCVFGGKLTALRYPERELVSVPAAQVYCEPIKPLTDGDSR